MKVEELLETEQDILDWKASKSLCKSSKPDSALGASALSSCVAQGYRARKTKGSQKIGNKRVDLGGKKLKSVHYGGPVKDWSGRTRTGGPGKINGTKDRKKSKVSGKGK